MFLLTMGCCVVLSVLVPTIRVDLFSFSDTMYATSDHVWYHSRSRGVPLLATVLGPHPLDLSSSTFNTGVLSMLWTILQQSQVD